MKNYLLGLLSAGVVALAATVAVIWGGLFPVAATAPEPPLIRSVIHAAYERAVARSAAEIAAPANLGDEARVLRGAYNFQAMCALCHTPPGAQASVQAQGMNPQPPALAELSERRGPAETYWVIKNGVRMTAMPAFGPTHESPELWALVAFLADARSRSAAGYGTLVAQAKVRFAGGDGHDHSHGAETMLPTDGEPKPGDRHDEDHGHHDADHPRGNPTDPHSERGHPHDAGHHHRGTVTPDDIPDRISQALIEGDRASLEKLLDDQVLIFESGSTENGFAEYAGHHMPADMRFLRSIAREPLDRKVFHFGDHAVVASRARLRGSYRDRAVDLVSTETLLL